MLKAYLSEMKPVNIELETGSCDDRGGEHSYAPGVDVIIERVGCFLDDENRANYRALLPVVHVRKAPPAASVRRPSAGHARHARTADHVIRCSRSPPRTSYNGSRTTTP